ncbi:glycoside hydrolase family 3 C-terminal domain-containing protein [uncultured Robinsoniella sp.]|uniref:glycoside hydrolase family 3 C-terminal domain-containing protein n=1 Tax=uncultured Robinsoniella sp. TaxID=904190 RepID=UPI00374EC0C8
MRNREEARKKAKELVAQMTLEEKASQLKYDAPPINRLGVPAYNWWNEALHGVARAGTATSFPQAIGMAAMFDDEMMKKIADTIATEGRAKYNAYSGKGDRDIYKGLTFWSPNVNIFRDPRWGRGHETYGEDPYLTSRLGVAFVEGLQGDKEVMKTAACAKHYAVHSGPEALRHEFNAVASKKDMGETYLPAFEALVKEAEVESVMGAYNRTNGEPCCGSNTLIRDILRDQWGFQGHFVSDCWAIKDFHENHRITQDAKESAAMALKAGCDVNCGNTYLHILKAYQAGLVTEEDITQAAERLFTTRFLLGLFDGSEYDDIPYEVVECKEHIQLARDAARKSAVLLKNNGVLPLKKREINTIGVIGPNADSRVALIGNYHGTASRYITILEGIQDEAGDDIRVLYSEGSGLWNRKVEGLAWDQDRISEAQIVAEHSDVVILAVGLDETLEGEEMDQGNHVGSGDKEDLKLPAVQMELIEKVLEIGKPTIVVLLAGSAIDLSYADEHADAILQAWYPGAGGGEAIADLLFGKISPSGKLPVTFYRDLEHMPGFEDYSMENRTYRYMEEDALYPFGYGLTYGNVEVEEAGFTIMPKKEQDFEVEVTLTNRGGTAVEEVVQLYIKDTKSALAVKNYSLCAFQRVALGAEETVKTTLKVRASALEAIDEEGRRVLDSDEFTLYAGISQPDRRSIQLMHSSPVELLIRL